MIIFFRIPDDSASKVSSCLDSVIADFLGTSSALAGDLHSFLGQSDGSRVN